jgi:SAM-dependent methyltransferase
MIEDFERNRAGWDASSDAYQARHRAQLEAAPDAWGVWSLPESELQLLGDVCDRDVLEYGCGAAAWSIALAQRGARVTALDNSARQLDYAREAIARAGVDVRLVHAAAEQTPFADAAFDIVFCDHGAMSFADPARTIPEVARILRTGGRFAFNLEHPLHAMAWNEAGTALGRSLTRAYFSLGRYCDPDDGIVSHSRPISGYVELLQENGFAIERLLEPQPPADTPTTYSEFAPLAWARDFPVELIIAARKVT